MTKTHSFLSYLDEKKLLGSYLCGNKNEIFCYKDIDSATIDSFIEQLGNLGYIKDQELYVNENLFITLISKKDLIHLTYISADKVLKVLYDPLCETIYKPPKNDSTRYTDATLSILPLDYSHREITDANGMAFVITLEDGSFIIIDGGYGDYISNGQTKSSSDAKNLYEYLCKQNKFANEKIKITAWIITHPHEDHYGAFVKFSELYSKYVSVEYFIYNQGDPSTYSKQYPADPFLADKMPKIIAAHYKNANIIKPHTGQTLDFCSTKITVLHTHESCIANFEPAPNDTSLVFRITANKETVLFMADCDESVSSLLVKTFGDYLKSGVMQINHHGYSGITKPLFDTVHPNKTIWTTSKKAFDLRTNGKKYEFIGSAVEVNKYIYDKLTNSGCIIADEQIKNLPL